LIEIESNRKGKIFLTNAEIEATEEIGKLLETINNLIQQDEDDDNMNMLKFIFILDLDQFAHLIL
jgi:hypothetical protein